MDIAEYKPPTTMVIQFDKGLSVKQLEKIISSINEIVDDWSMKDYRGSAGKSMFKSIFTKEGWKLD
ncbi:MAG: hypothetical protein GWN01_05400 [Nitrosopumilaceae archaeon]|nr:hypothetical protein [Nitrosopumilaceae archaeon]NIU86781.1 hypothetical protein [Nitrosopumilaceae archaeon]NIX60981.1 hypothetical protein [Nitrosopumilaceae archaeon]